MGGRNGAGRRENEDGEADRRAGGRAKEFKGPDMWISGQGRARWADERMGADSGWIGGLGRTGGQGRTGGWVGGRADELDDWRMVAMTNFQRVKLLN